MSNTFELHHYIHLVINIVVGLVVSYLFIVVSYLYCKFDKIQADSITFTLLLAIIHRLYQAILILFPEFQLKVNNLIES